jgi:hypothetical protein
MENLNLIWNYYSNENPLSIRILSIEKEILRFEYLKERTLTNEIVLKAGYEYISSTFYKHEIPTESEIEYAINHIEDELMSSKELLNNNEKLVCTDMLLIELLRKNGELKETYTSRNIEDIFSKYANLSMGEPLARSGLSTTKDDFAIILALREIMHHLKFKEISILEI